MSEIDEARREWLEERIAIAVHHGGIDEAEAEMRAEFELSRATKATAPEVWGPTSRQWHAEVTERLGTENKKKAREKLKERHDAESWNDLTVGQIEESLEKLKRSTE